MKKILSGVIAVFTLLLVVGTASAAANWFQGFETDKADWNDFAGGVVTRVATGTGGITSSDGVYHATVTGPVYTNWGGYESVFPTDGYVTEIDIYLDMAENPSIGTDKRFDFSSAINNPAGSHNRDFIFNVGTDPLVAGQFIMSASNNAPGWPSNPGRSPETVDTNGWYTFRHTFQDDGTGVLEVVMDVLDDGGALVGSWTLSDPSDVIGSTVGGNRYGWFTSQRFDFTSLAIDNSTKNEIILPPPVIIASVNGGGQLLEEGDKKKDWLKVSFGGNVELYDDDSLSGEFQVNLHNVNADFDKSKFHGSEVTEINFFDGDNNTCNDAVNITVNGTFDGEEGYSMIFRAGDFGSPNTEDTIRVTIYNGLNATGGILYDTHASGEFSDESSCVGSARTGLDNGNITISK